MLQADAPAKEFSTERCLQCGWEREEYEERIRFLENRVRLQDAELQGKEDRIRELKDRIQALEDQIKVLQKRPARPKIRPSGLARAGENGRAGAGRSGKPRRRGPRRPTPALRQRGQWTYRWPGCPRRPGGTAMSIERSATWFWLPRR